MSHYYIKCNNHNKINIFILYYFNFNKNNKNKNNNNYYCINNNGDYLGSEL